MATPNIGSGVIEVKKPRGEHGFATVYRFEGVIGAGSSITTPIFDVVGDGWPYNELEVGSFNVVRVSSPVFRVFVLINTTAGMRLTCFHVQDNGNQQTARQVYIPLDDAQGQFVGWRAVGRRVQFRLQNSPFAVAGVNSDTRFEVLNGGEG